MAESTLVSFRRAIATHLTGILGQSIESLLPLVQQNTSHRKASHSVFSVVIKRLQQLQSRSSGGGTTTVLDEQVLERCCTELSADTREYIVRVWRTKDMLLFDPQPLQLIQKAVGAIVERAGARERVGAKEEEELLLGKRAREELSSGGKKVVDVIVDGMKTLQDESAFSSLRRTVLTGFVARFLLSESNGAASVKVLADLGRDEFLQDLDVESPTLSNIVNDSDDGFLETIKHALRTEPEIKAQWSNTEDGAWVVDMSAQKLGQVKVFSSSRTGLTSDEKAKEMGDPTVVVETLVRMARRFARYDGGGGEGKMRYIWVIPDGRRLFAEQVLFLARIIFPGVGRRLQSDAEVDCSISEDEPERKKRAGATVAESDVVKDSRSSAKTKSWADSVELVYYGPAMGVDLPKGSPLFTAATSNGGGEMSEVIDYTNVKMREVVEQNRGGGGVGGYSGAYGNDGYDADDGDDEGDGAEVLDKAELTRMSNILSRSAVVVSCCGGKRARKLNISMSRILDGKGNSGVFLQYVLSRLYGIERKSKARLNASADLAHISSYTESLDLALLLAEYPEILSGIHESLDPSVLVTYLFNLAAMVGQANRVLRVKGMEVEVAEARWLVFWAAKRVFEEGLMLLGLEFLERM